MNNCNDNNPEFVPFDIAKLLYDNNITCESCLTMMRSDQYNIKCYAAPLYQTVFKEFRKRGIYIMIIKDCSTENGWHFFLVKNNDFMNAIYQEESNDRSYEQAMYDALIYVLKYPTIE